MERSRLESKPTHANEQIWIQHFDVDVSTLHSVAIPIWNILIVFPCLFSQAWPYLLYSMNERMFKCSWDITLRESSRLCATYCRLLRSTQISPNMHCECEITAVLACVIRLTNFLYLISSSSFDRLIGISSYEPFWGWGNTISPLLALYKNEEEEAVGENKLQ